MRAEGRSYGRGRRPRSKQDGTLLGAAIATWSALLAAAWLVSWTLGC